MLFPLRPIFLFPIPIPIKAKHLVLGYAVLTLLMIQAPAGGIAHLAHLGGLVCGYLFIKIKYHARLPYRFAEETAAFFKRKFRFRIRIRKKPDLRVMNSEDFMASQIDPILEKISRSGLKSLTRKEKKILRQARSHMK